MQNASVCASSLVIAGECVTRSQVFLVQRWPFTTFPLTFYVKNDWAGFFSQESLWFLLTSCFKWEDLFILSWTISFLLEWMKSWFRRDSWIIFSAWLFPVIGLYMDRWFEYYSLSVERPNIFTRLSFTKMYKGPSRTGGTIRIFQNFRGGSGKFYCDTTKIPDPSSSQAVCIEWSLRATIYGNFT